MGTDIHCFVEQKMYRTDTYETDPTGNWIWIHKTDHAGTWISIDKWTKDSMAILYPERNEGPVWNVEREDMVFTDRNYGLFAILANQRNSENMPYISAPRGLPEDVSPEIPLQIRALEGHDTTWFTAKELIDYNWDQVFEFEDENMNGEKIYETVNYRECGSRLLEVIHLIVARNNPADFRLIMTFDC
ncbi:hypothetical protein [Paenibacillus pedocola]|uniref:hypothetical protein n=1 Tax=Paenibacillus pedocola TaxID=3242193 RepID=UPI002877EF6D|nr:hypothetical protein [Paenibacillus typhae]